MVGTISSGAVRTYLGRTHTTREGLGIVPNLMRLVSESISTGTTSDDDSTRQVAAYLSRLVLRYGTMRRAIEAVALARRKHPLISADKANAWNQALSVSMGSIEPTLRRYEWLRIQLSKWLSEHGLGLERELTAFEAWLDGPLPGSDDEHEFPVLAEAGAGGGAGGGEGGASPAVAETEDPAPIVDVRSGHPAPQGVGEAGSENEDIRLARWMLWATKRPASSFGEPAPSKAERGALERLRASDEAYSRAMAGLADRDLGVARSCLKLLEALADTPGLATLRADVLYMEERFDESISTYRAALSIASKGDEQAMCMGNLAMALMRAQRGSAVDRAREARSLLARAAEQREAKSESWAIAQMQRGLAEMCPPQIDREESARAAISCLESAAAALDGSRGPGWWAESMYWLGDAWLGLTTGNRRESVERAIARFNDALSALSRSETPDRWAATQAEMAIAWERMPSRNREEALEHAIGCLMSALSVRKKERDPVGWARIQNNLGNLWVQFPGGNQRQNVERAIAHQQSALEVWSDQGRRVEWATTQSNLGNAYALLPAEGEQREKNLRRAIACYKAALEVRTRSTYPLEWATTLNNLGSALIHLPKGVRGSNVKEAIAAYRQALEVRTRESFPLDWAKTQANLGNALVKDPTGYKGDNLAEAISFYQSALDVYTRERFPRQHEVISQRLRDTQSELRRMQRPM